MPKSRFSQRIRNKLNRSKKAEVPQTPLQNLQPSSSFFPRNHRRRQQVLPQKAVRDAKPERLLQTVKDNRQRKKPNEKKEQQKKKTPSRTKSAITIQILQRQRIRRQKQKNGKITPAEEKILKTKFTSEGPALFGSVHNLKEESKISRSKWKCFLHTEPAYTKYRTVRRKTPRLKVIVNDIDEIWSIDLAYADKLADYNKNIKYLMVAVDCMSRFLCVQPLKSKYATSSAEAFKHKIKTKQPKKIWVDKGTEFKGSFKSLCEEKDIETYTTESEKKICFRGEQDSITSGFDL